MYRGYRIIPAVITVHPHVPITVPPDPGMLIAVRNNDIETVRNFLKNGYDFNVITNHHFCLQSAIAQGNFEMIELLLKSGPNLHNKEHWSQYRSTMHAAISQNDRETRWQMIMMLMDAGLRIVDEHRCCYTGNTDTCVHLAVSKNDFDLVQLFMVNHGSELNCFDSHGRHTLSRALQLDTDESSIKILLKQLIEAGANVNLANQCSSTCLYFAAALKDCSWELIKVLLDAGALLDWVDNYGYSPLAVAAKHGNYELVQRMIEAGADININQRCTNSPLELAMRHHHKNIVEILLDNGADVGAQDYNGCNILYCAADNFNESKVTESIEILKIVLNHGASINRFDYGAYVPFQAVLRHANLEMMKLFFERGIQLEECGVQFPLHLAAMNMSGNILEYLLKSLLYDVDEVDASGSTALFIAIGAKNFACFRLLIEWGADVNIPFKAVSNDLLDGYRRSVSHMVSSNSSQKSGTTPFIDALYRREPLFLDLLILTGANLPRNINENTHDFIRDILSDDDVSECLIKQITLRKSQGYLDAEPNGDNSFMKMLFDENPDYLELMQECSSEIELLKTKRLYGCLTLYDLLTGVDFTRLINNGDLIKTFESLKVIESYHFYGSLIDYRYSMTQTRRKVLDHAKTKLKKLLGSQFNTCDSLLHDIITYLHIKDLCSLCKV
ncbi:hypothetical protein QAD02_006520 [Eretmocerus hayati]|uniref:Uncharacterized protein n=1 Tax=Eretmocerus hayati TaxID=131215 RepID=A0ACC2N1K4_9HYME|nr:hypothetical protein QAD02_006520 [Eretmocerus hayati]